jgi:hypothetical protein
VEDGDDGTPVSPDVASGLEDSIDIDLHKGRISGSVQNEIYNVYI